MERPGGSPRFWLGALGPLHDRLLGYVLAAAAAGILLPGAATRLNGVVPLFLAGQVAGVALTLEARRLAAVLRRPLVLVAALAAQWTVLPLCGLAAAHLLPAGLVRDGIVVCAASPAEITSALVAVLAGGLGELAIAAMAGSLALGTVLTPVWVHAILGDVAVDEGALVGELALCVALPLVGCVGLRSILPGLARQGARCLDLAAFSVVAVVFVAAGSVRAILGSLALPAAVALSLALQAAGYATGAALGRLLPLPRGGRRALLFPLGMREFGIATAVALAVRPEAAAVGGVYGVLVMAAGPALALRLRRTGRPQNAPTAG